MSHVWREGPICSGTLKIADIEHATVSFFFIFRTLKSAHMWWITVLFTLKSKLRITSDWSIIVIYMAWGSDSSYSIQIQRVTDFKQEM